MLTNWDKRFIDLAKVVSTWTKDTSRGVGAVIVDNRNRIVSVGYNGFPTGINDDVPSRNERPLKYKYTEHAERNAIYNSNIKLYGCKIYVTLFPCTDCTKGIIQTGIVEVICPDINTKDGWYEDFEISKEMLKEAGVFLNTYK